jgi:transcription elongation GreA/GreB family factor
MNYIRNGKTARNLDRTIRFTLDGEELTRRLVLTAHDLAEEISVASPVGVRLANAEAEKEFIIPLPEEQFIVVKVLEVVDSVTPVVA